ncbi:hypothetical protein J6590_059088 [Homalodisca vitripennis]|nr:hypothetical protein J6590_059088 [Homalodisca vitripennis]
MDPSEGFIIKGGLWVDDRWEMIQYKANGTDKNATVNEADRIFEPALSQIQTLFCPFSCATGLCKDLIKQNKGESRYSTRSMSDKNTHNRI